MKPTLPPEATGRLFPDVAEETLGDDAFASFWIGRLLEEGEEADLRWLTGRLPEQRLRLWLERRGGRQLSCRSRAFWRLVLGGEHESAPAVVDELWNL